MGDISSNLPVRGALGDLVVNIAGLSGATMDPASEGTQKSVLAGVTAIQALDTSMLAGITAIEALDTSILAGVTAIEALDTSILAGVTGLEAIDTDILAGVTGLEAIDTAILEGVTGLEAIDTSILAGVTSLEAIETNILAGVTAIEALDTSILAGVTGLEAIETNILAGVTAIEALDTSILAGVTAIWALDTSILAGVTGIEAQLPAKLGATAMSASLSVAMATDQNPIPVYVTTDTGGSCVVQFNTLDNVATNSGLTGSYSAVGTFVLDRVHAAGSGRIKVDVYTGDVTGWAYDDNHRKWVGFNSSSEPNVDIDCSQLKLTSTPAQKVEVIVTNLEPGKTQQLYSTIVGDEK